MTDYSPLTFSISYYIEQNSVSMITSNILTMSLRASVTVELALPPFIRIADLVFSVSFGSLFSRNLLALFVLGFLLQRNFIIKLAGTKYLYISEKVLFSGLCNLN